MTRTRSRPKTEEKFQNAVLQLLVKEGCGALGINAVAQQAGADKVLIYRYFGDLNGLLQRVAESRQWLPTGEDLLSVLRSGESDALRLLRKIEKTLLLHIRADASTPTRPLAASQHLPNLQPIHKRVAQALGNTAEAPNEWPQ